MFSSGSEALGFIDDTKVRFLDVRLTDLPGVQQHLTVPSDTVDEAFLTDGIAFDRGVFTPELIETWIEYKREKEIKPLAQRPHPFEYELYYGV